MTVEIDTKFQMKRCIGLFSSFSIIVGAVIGSGIFVSPVAIVRQCHSVGLSLSVWLAGGVLMLGLILSYVELAMMFPRAGGDYAYIMEINGPVVAFLRVYMELMMIRPASCVIMSLTTVNYVMVGIFGQCDVNQWSVKMLAACLIVLMVAINCLYTKYTTTLQNIMTSAKIVSLVMIISAGMYYIHNGNTENFEQPFKGSTTNPGNIAIAVFAGMYSYGGWRHLFGLIEEIRRPERTLPRASILSILFIIVIYILTNVSYLAAMQPEVMSQSKAVAMTFASKTMGRLANFIPFMVATSTIGALNCSILGGSRVAFAAARDGLFPASLAMLNKKYLTPWMAMISISSISFVYLFISDALTLIEYQAFIAVSFQIVVVYDLVYMRYKKPNLHRPFKLPIIIPIICGLFINSLMLLGFYKNPIGNCISFLILLSGIPVYWLLVKGQLNCVTSVSRKATVLIQKILLVQPQDK